MVTLLIKLFFAFSANFAVERRFAKFLEAAYGRGSKNAGEEGFGVHNAHFFFLLWEDTHYASMQ